MNARPRSFNDAYPYLQSSTAERDRAGHRSWWPAPDSAFAIGEQWRIDARPSVRVLARLHPRVRVKRAVPPAAARAGIPLQLLSLMLLQVIGVHRSAATAMRRVPQVMPVRARACRRAESARGRAPLIICHCVALGLLGSCGEPPRANVMRNRCSLTLLFVDHPAACPHTPIPVLSVPGCAFGSADTHSGPASAREAGQAPGGESTPRSTADPAAGRCDRNRRNDHTKSAFAGLRGLQESARPRYRCAALAPRSVGGGTGRGRMRRRTAPVGSGPSCRA